MIGPALFALALVASWGNSATHVVLSDRPLYAFTTNVMTMPIRTQRLAWAGVASVGFLAALWLWAASGWPRLGAAAVIAALLAIRQVETRQWPGQMVVRLGKYVPAASCLTGWLIVVTLTRTLGWDEPRSVAAGWEAAAGVMAALYPLAALSKLKLTGWRWMRAEHHALMIAERAYTGPMWVRRARSAGSRSWAVCAFVGTFGLLSEFACAAYIFPDARIAVTATVLALHAGIGLFLGYFEPEWLLVMIAIAAITT